MSTPERKRGLFSLFGKADNLQSANASSEQPATPCVSNTIAPVTNGHGAAPLFMEKNTASAISPNGTHAPAPPASSPIDQMLSDIYSATKTQRDGAVADYIPELSKVNAEAFGIAIATSKGKVHTIGDAQSEFTIQSTSKALTYCLALELCGRDQVFARVGVEPSGDPFNAIEFSPLTRRPYNPMVNAGAITISGMLRDAVGAAAALDLVMERFSQAAGRTLHINEDVYRSEATTGHRNRAIGHLLLSVGALSEPVDEALDLYFRQCSIMVSATDLAMMGATLANLGVHPVTGRQVFDIDAVRDTQSVMFTCGMYDYSGGWAFNVGIPAKSGVGGGIMGIVNRQLGIGTFSPRLDPNGNSVRGIASFKMMSDSLGLHTFDLTNTGSAFVGSFFEEPDASVESAQA